MAPIRVLHIIDKLSMDGMNPSSIAKLFSEWFPRFNQEKFQMLLCCLKAADGSNEFLKKKGISVIYLNKGKYSFSIINDLKQLILNENISIVHLHGYSSANYGRIAAKKVGIPVVMHEHAVLKELPHQSLADWLLRNKVDIAIGASEAVKGFLTNGRHVSPNRTRILRYGIDLSRFQNQNHNKFNSIRKKFGISQKQILIGSVTRLYEVKGNQYFIKSAKIISEKFTDARFIIFGDGPLRDELEKLVFDLHLHGVFIFAGFVEDPVMAYNALDIFVLPSLMEGLPLALLEAMACGKPMVITAVGGMKEIVEECKNGILVPPADAEALAESIMQLLSNPNLSQQLADTALKRSSDFTIEKNVKALEKIYLELY